MNELPVVFIAGPTASGKTELAMRLMQERDVVLINVDAAQVYRGMDIGTAKLNPTLLKQYPHALIDIRDPLEIYNAWQFVNDATLLIKQAHAKGKLPVLVGGTLLYFSALENGISALPAADASVRAQIDVEASKLGWDGLYRKLQAVDPKYCETISIGDRQRIQRALEIHKLTDEIPSVAIQKGKAEPLAASVYKFNLFTPDRKLLHQRIELRFNAMLKSGLVEEVQGLKNRGDLHLDLPSMRCIGYRQVWQYLAEQIDYDTMVDKGVAATRQLAKRQLTWLRHQRGQIWLSSEYENNVELILPFLA